EPIRNPPNSKRADTKRCRPSSKRRSEVVERAALHTVLEGHPLHPAVHLDRSVRASLAVRDRNIARPVIRLREIDTSLVTARQRALRPPSETRIGPVAEQHLVVSLPGGPQLASHLTNQGCAVRLGQACIPQPLMQPRIPVHLTI